MPIDVNQRSTADEAAPMPGGSAAMRFQVLDSWRGISALMVVLFHAQIASDVRDLAIVRGGEMFVDFFFVLSGFVIAHAYAGRLSGGGDVGRFMLLRLGRVYPLHLVVLALFVAFECVKAMVPGVASPSDPAFSGSNAPATIAANLLMLQGTVLAGGLSWNTPSWSISAEFVAYALFAAAALVAGRRLWIAATVGAATSIVLLVHAPYGMESTWDFGAFRALYGFCVGVLLHRAMIASLSDRRSAAQVRPGRSATLAWTLAELVAIFCVAAFVIAAYKTDAAIAAPLVFGLVIGVFAHEAGLVSALLKHRMFLLVGALSFSIYMIHMFVLLRVLNIAKLSDMMVGTHFVRSIGPNGSEGAGIDLGSAIAGDVALVAVLAVTVAAAWFTRRFVELPSQAWFKRIAAAKSGRQVPVGQALAAHSARGLA